MRFLLLISILFTIHSCKLPYKIVENYSDTKSYPTCFISESKSLLYRTKVDAFGNYFSGLLFIKPHSADSVRIVFMSELGLKFFDFEINGNENKINYCLDALNKPYIVNTLVNDFRIMLLKSEANKVKFYNTEDENIIIAKFSKPFKSNCKMQKNTEQILELKHKHFIFNVLKIDYSDYANKIPQKINIKHKNIKLNIELSLLENK